MVIVCIVLKLFVCVGLIIKDVDVVDQVGFVVVFVGNDVVYSIVCFL